MKTALLATAGTVALLLPTSALAQVDEIVVTATKREQTLQEIPVAVSVVQEDTIEKAQIIDVFDLQTVVPSLSITQNQSSQNTTFSIRGFGNGGNNVGIEPSVGVFIDGVFRSRSASAISDLIDIERVEVLRGPQSTLFGKNASAGVVSVVTKDPEFDFSGRLELTLGNFDSRIVRGYVTGPITDTVAYSLAASYNQRDGVFENFAGGPDFNDRDRYSVRGKLLAEPTDQLSIRLIADYDQLTEVCCFAGNAKAGPTADIIEALGGEILRDDIFAGGGFQDVTPTNEIANYGFSGQVDYDIGDIGTITSITAYRDRDGDENIDADFTSLELVDANPSIINFETFTQELRFSGEIGRVGFLVGGLYLNENVTADTFISYGDDFRAYGTALALLGAGVPPSVAVPAAATDDPLIGPDGAPQNPIVGLELALGLPSGTFFNSGTTFETQYDQDNESLSLFGQVDVAITDRLTITGGIAYNYDEKQVSLDSFNTDAFSSLNFVDIGFAGAFGAAVEGALASPLGALVEDPTVFAAGPTPDALAAYSTLVAAAGGALPSVSDLQAIALDPAQNPLLGLTALQFLPPQTDFPNAVEDGETEDDDVTYTARIAYDLTDRINVYGSYATGFKASSFNLTRDGRPLPEDIPGLTSAGLLPNTTAVPLGTYVGTRFAGPEETRVFEVGAKARFNWGSINVALFDQEIEGFQSTIFQGTGFVLANAGEQSVRGAEVEIYASPIENLDIQFAATYLDPEFDEFVGAPGPDGPFDASGLEVPGQNELLTSTVVTYTQPTNFGEAFVRGEWQWASEEETTALNVPLGVISQKINTFNASIGADFDNGFEALLFARNLFQDEYPIVAFPSVAQAGSFSAYPNVPRTYGITVRKNF